MYTNRPLPKKLNVQSIQFPDNSVITSAANLSENVIIKKRLRVEGTTDYAGDVVFGENVEINKNATIKRNLIVRGSVSATGPISYVDNQTGWGLSSWTRAGAIYNKNVDSLIAKINNINGRLSTEYATNVYVISMTQLNSFMSIHNSGDFPLYSGTGNYTMRVVRPASNTIFLIRDDSSNTSPFKFQRGSVGVGKYLRCADSDGTVEWANISADIPNLSSISTTVGPSSTAAYSVVDTTGGTRGVYFYPNLPSNSGYNSSILQGDIGLLGGTGNATTGATRFGFCMGTFNGNQAIRFTSDILENSLIVRGTTVLSGGSSSAKITLGSNGTTFDLAATERMRIFLTPRIADGVTTQGNVEIAANGWPMNTSTSVFQVTRSNTETPTAKRQMLMINPLSPSGAYNPITEDFDYYIYTAALDGSQGLRSQQLHLGHWSDYCDAVSVRQTILSEEGNSTSNPVIPASTNFSGHVRLSACCAQTQTSVVSGGVTYVKRTPNTYLIVDRQGIKLKVENSKKIIFYGATEIQNYTGAIVNDPTTTTRTSSFQIGSSTSNVSSTIFGVMKYYYSSLGTTDVQNYILSASTADGSMIWRTANDALPSSVSKALTFTNTLRYSKDAATILTDANSTYVLKNTNLNGDVAWAKLPISDSGIADVSISFQNVISLFNETSWINRINNTNTVIATEGAKTVTVNAITKRVKYLSTPQADTDFIFSSTNTANDPPFDSRLKIQKYGVNAQVLKIAGSYPSVSEFTSPNRVDMEKHNKVVTDLYTKRWSSTITDFNLIGVTEPGQLCVPGFYNYRAYNSTSDTYDTPARGDMLINWNLNTYTPPDSITSEESYGQATWKNFSDICFRSIDWDQYFQGDVYVGSENAYTHNKFGVSTSVAKNASSLRVFGKIFFRSAASDSATGSSPLNQVLTCTNATTGEVGWGNVTATYPATATFTSISTTTLNASGLFEGSRIQLNSSNTAGLQITNGGVTSNSVTTTTLNTSTVTATGAISTTSSGTFGSVIAGASSTTNTTFTSNGRARFNQDIQYNVSPTINHVLTCTDTSGTLAWKALPTSNSTSTFTTITTTNLNIGSDGSNMSQINNSGQSIITFSAPNTEAALNIPSLTPVVSTDQSFTSSGVQAFRFQPPTSQNDPYIYHINAPVHTRFRFNFRNNYLPAPFNTEEKFTRLWVEITTFRVNIVDTFTRIGSFYDITNDAQVDAPWCTSFRVDRNKTITASTVFQMQCKSSATMFEIVLPMLTTFYLPFASDDPTKDYTIDYQIIGRYKFEGEAINIQNADIYMNPPVFTDGGVYSLKCTPSGSDLTNPPDIRLFGEVLQNASYGVVVSGTENANYRVGPRWSRDRNHIKKLPITGQDLVLLTMGNVSISDCHVRRNLYVPAGTIYACGLAGRKGMPSKDSDLNPVGDRLSRNALNAFGNIFNFFWTRQGNWQVWVDTTLVHSTSANFSDYRLKTNLSTLEPVLDRLCSIPMYRYDTFPYKSMPAMKNKIGFLAHEVQSLFPDIPNLIENEKDAVDSTNNPLLQLFNEKELLMLVLKGLQEAREEINFLKQEIHNLKTQIIL
jgi:hypothetical protein